MKYVYIYVTYSKKNTVHENQGKYDKYYEHVFRYGDCTDGEREMTIDCDVSWQIILDKHS